MKVEEVNRIAVIGVGLMGHGIAQEFALAGYPVSIYDVSEDKLQQAVLNIGSNLHMLAEIGIIAEERIAPTLSNLHPGTKLPEVVSTADFVIEAVFENLELKQGIFRQLDQSCPEHTILASNTSTIMPSMLAAVTRRPGKVLVTHYFNPPYLLPLVEIVRHKTTTEETVRVVHDLLSSIGKNPAVVQKEVPGFVGNRLQLALFREALSIVEQGIATPEDVDTIVKTGFGRRYAAAGPFEIWELAGWDLILAISEYLQADLESSKEISALLKNKVEKGELGTKTGKGFFDWTPESIEALKQRIGRVLADRLLAK